MVFNSLEFLIFFAVVIIVYQYLNTRQKRIFLLLSSYFFYMWWKPAYIILILLSTTVDFFAAQKIFNSKNEKQKKFFLFLSIFTNLGILFVFKYLNFFSEVLQQLISFYKPLKLKPLEIVLPVGISFYTFQTLGYTIDVYRGKIKPEKNFINFALFVSFFPQLVAGPIERAKNLLSQINSKIKVDWQQADKGFILIIWGMFLKVVVADNLAVFVDKIFAHPQAYSGINMFIGILFFAFQIYCDFGGYSLIAIGTAKILGFKLMDNFKQPYFATSVKDFWHRWHISLSTWFRDYVYIPLGGNKVSFGKWALIIIITFTISGLWHGANWTFILWGFANAIIFIFEHLLRKNLSEKTKKFLNKKTILFLRKGFVFALILLLWVLFRAENLAQIKTIYSKLFTLNFNIMFDPKLLILNFGLIFIVLITDFLQQKANIDTLVSEKSKFFQISFAYLTILAIFFIGNWHIKQFIYFQF